MTTFVDVHIIQTVPPSNLNRDESGSPKTAIYGGARRARVSSQAWKRATRVAFANPKDGNVATRTKRLAGLIADRLIFRHGQLGDEQALRIANAMLAPLKLSAKKHATEVDYLMFVGYGQIDRFVDAIHDVDALANLDDKQLKAAFEALDLEAPLLTGHPVDVALFGRMVADATKLNVDAACQVAHAISTHPVETEYDYYTAVDDEKAADESVGAGMIGTVEFNSATLYRYANVNLDALADNLDGDRDRAIDAALSFVESFTLEMPSGKSNTFANRTLPHAIVVQVRDRPMNCATAFEQPIESAHGNARESLVRLADEVARLERLWVGPAALTAATYEGAPHDHLGESMPLAATLDRVRSHLASTGDEDAA